MSNNQRAKALEVRTLTVDTTDVCERKTLNEGALCLFYEVVGATVEARWEERWFSMSLRLIANGTFHMV